MALTETVGNKVVTLDSGKIIVDGKKVGTIVKSLKYGYHPTILVTVKKIEKYVELDEVGEGYQGLFKVIHTML